jgi:RIO-like serine/threonine protein kinase
MASGLSVQIDGHEWVKDHTEFVFQVSYDGTSATRVRKRFRKLHAFDQQLQLALSGTAAAGALSTFPSRLPFGHRLPIVVHIRQTALQRYFEGLLALKSPYVDERIREFMESGTTVGHRTVSLATTTRTLEDDIIVAPDIVGEGVNGAVHLATRKQTNAKCVVKTMQVSRMSPRAFRQFQTELEVHTSVDHPLIAKLEDVYDSGDQVHLVLEHLSGGDLFDRISQRRQLPEAEAVGVVRLLLQAVAYLHGQGIIHGDLKPENAVFEDKGGGKVKLIDFGAARRWDKQKPVPGIKGTLMYMAPEACLGGCTDKVDMWSMAIITYTMLCGCSPWRSTDPAQMRRDIMANTPFFHPRKWNRLSSKAQNFIKVLMHSDPCRRPSALEALEHPWLQDTATDDISLAAEMLVAASPLASAAEEASCDQLKPHNTSKTCSQETRSGSKSLPSEGSYSSQSSKC